MKARLPKMLLTALLAAMTTAYAGNTVMNNHQYYYGTETISDPSSFATAPLTVNIGYGEEDGTTHDANITLRDYGKGNVYSTPNALFIGGPGWRDQGKLPAGYGSSKGVLELSDVTLLVGVDNPSGRPASHITMGSYDGAKSELYVGGNSKIYTGHLEASNGGGSATIEVGSKWVQQGHGGEIHLSGDLMLGINDVSEGAHAEAELHIFKYSSVDVQGTTSVGYWQQGEYYAGEGAVTIDADGTLDTGALVMGVGLKENNGSGKGTMSVNGTLNVKTGDTHLGINGGVARILVGNNGNANLGNGDVYMGISDTSSDPTTGKIGVEKGTLTHGGTMYLGNTNAGYGVGILEITEDSTANLHNVEVSGGSKIYVDGNVSVNENAWGEYSNQPGIHLYDGAYVGGAPKGSQLTMVSFRLIGEEQANIHMYKDGLTLTEGTTFKACCDTHIKVGEGTSLTFGEGVMWLTDGLLYIDSDNQTVGTITTTAGTGNISVAGNRSILDGMEELVRNDETSRLGLIDTADFIDWFGNDDAFVGDDPNKLKLVDNSAYEVRYTGDTPVDVLNSDQDFYGFYLVKVGYPSEDAYPTFDQNQREVYDIIKELEESGTEIPQELKEVIEAVLDTDGREHPEVIQEALDFLGAVNYSVMMHNQIDGNTSHQRMLRNRSMAGRNLRHKKGCTDVYAAGFYDGQRVNGSRSKGEGYHRTEWGGLVGADTCINDNLRLGADLAYGRARINPSHNWAMHQDSFYWDVYAQFRKGNWRSITALGMGIHSFDLKRGIGARTAKADNVKGYSFNFTEEISYDWKLNEKTTIQPFAALDLNWNTIKSFTDGDLGGMNVHVKKQDALAADLTLGGRYIRDFALLSNVPDATWYAQLGVVVSMGKTDSDMDCNFVGAPDHPFTIKAADRDRVGLDLGAGITIPVKENWAIFANGEAILRGDSHNINAQIGVQVAF